MAAGTPLAPDVHTAEGREEDEEIESWLGQRHEVTGAVGRLHIRGRDD
jgi:hypothetical protein